MVRKWLIYVDLFETILFTTVVSIEDEIKLYNLACEIENYILLLNTERNLRTRDVCMCGGGEVGVGVHILCSSVLFCFSLTEVHVSTLSSEIREISTR